MRTFLTLVFVSTFFIRINAQDRLKESLPLINGKVTYTNTIMLDSVLKDEIYNRAKHWLAFNSDRIMIDNKDELIGQGHFLVDFSHVWYSISIHFKDGRYKYEITNFQVIHNIVINGDSRELEVNLEEYFTFLGMGDTKFYNKMDSRIKILKDSFEKTLNTRLNDNW